MERAFLALCALLVNAMLAGRRWYMPPVVVRLYLLPSQVLRELERKLNREHRGEKELQFRGFILVIAGILVGILGGVVLHWVFSQNLHFLEIAMLALLLPVRQSWDVTAQIKRSFGNLQAMRAGLADTPWRHHALLDEHGVARAGIEFLAVQFAEKILSPVLWYLCFGLPGFFICKIVTLMQETLPSNPFGKGARLAHDALHYLPARLAALLWIMAAWFLPSANIQTVASRVWKGFSRPQAHALILLTAASALRLSLGGPTSIYTGGQWLGEGTARATVPDLRRAQYLFVLLLIFLFLFLGFLLF